MGSKQSLEMASTDMFSGELNGAIDPSDTLHQAAFKARIDPYSISRLTIWPSGEVPSKMKKLQPSSWCSKSASDLLNPSSITSMPKISGSTELIPGQVKKKVMSKSATDFRKTLDFKS